MVITSGNCIVPFALWNSHCPQHAISSLLVTKDKRHLITGSCDGQIVKWNFDDNFKSTPVYMLLGHETRVTNLCLAYEDEDRVYFVSSTETGEMCLWDMDDGRCVLHRTNSRFIHTSIQSHAAAYNRRTEHADGPVSAPKGSVRLLFCCGRYPMLVVLEATSLQPLFHLSSRSHPTRFTALTVFSHPNQPTDVVLGLSANQAVTVWTVGAADSWPALVTNPDGTQTMAAPSQKSENESKTIQCPGGQVVAMRCCPKNPRTVLIVSQRTWQVHDAVDWCLLCSLSVEEENGREGYARWEWTGGEFISLDTVLVHNSEGSARLYRLPVCAIAGQTNFRQMKDRGSPVLVASFSSSPCPPVLLQPQDCLSDTSSNFSMEDGVLVELPKFAFHFETPVLVRGDAQGTITVWTDHSNTLERLAKLPSRTEQIEIAQTASLQELWDEAKPRGLVDCLLPRDVSGAQSSVTASAFAQLPGKLLMGLASGDILVASVLDCMAHVFFESRPAAALGPPCHMRLSDGHSRAVSALCYPANRLRSNSSAPGEYPVEILVSGGCDFTVRLWDLNTGSQVANFSPHGAPVMAIVATPEQCSKRVQGSVCCIAADHSVSLIGLRDRKVHLVANLQPQPIAMIKWRPLEDFMLIGCTDGSVFVWETTSGHLDRFLGPGPAANAALAAGEHPFRVPARLYRRHGCAIDSTQIPQEEKGGLVGGGRVRVADRARIAVSDLRPLKLQSIRGSALDAQDWHILFFDTEALVSKLLMEEAARKAGSSSAKDSSRSSGPQGSAARQPLISRVMAVFPSGSRSPEPPRKRADATATTNGGPEENETGALDLALLLISLLHAWDLDPGLDRSCTATLGLLRPRRPVFYGSLSHSSGFVCLFLPQARPQPPYWLASAHLSTQYLLAVVSVSNTLMQLMERSQLRSWPMFCERMALDAEPAVSQRSLASFGTIKQSWSLLTAHHCVLLPDLVGPAFRRPRLAALARKWQDRCLQIREAAQTLLLSQLSQMGQEGRQALLLRWSPFLPEAQPGIERLRLSSITSVDEELLGLQLAVQNVQPLREMPPEKRPPERPPPPRSTKHQVSSNVSNGAITLTRCPASEGHQLQALAVILLGIIGAEYGGADSGAKGQALEGFGRDDYHLSRQICRALIALVLPQANQSAALTAGVTSAAASGGSAAQGVPNLRRRMTIHGYPLSQYAAVAGSRSAPGPPLTSASSSGSSVLSQQHTAMRLAATEILGRGFAVWEPYIDVSALLVTLLEYSLASPASPEEIEGIISSGVPLSPSADKARTARLAVDLIALARPRLFILTLSREIKRYNSVAANSQLAGSAAPTSMPIFAARWLILRSLEKLCDKRMMEVVEVLSEAMEVLLHCVDLTALKDSRGAQSNEPLRDVFPPIGRFANVTSSLKSQKIAIGTKAGGIVLYDFKQGKFNTVTNAHPGAISSISFHPNGKHLATFSLQDKMMRIWQLGSATIFGMVGTQLKCVTTRPLHAVPDQGIQPDLRGGVFVEWLDNRSVALYSSSGMVDKMRVL